MIPLKDSEWGGKSLTAEIIFKIEIHLPNDENRNEISEDEAMGIVAKEMDYYASSNDGSELFANVGYENIRFEK